MSDPKPNTPPPAAILCLAAAVASAGVNEDGSAVGVSEVVLKRGSRVTIFNAAKPTPVVTFDGDISAFINELAQYAHPNSVRVRSRDVERTMKHEGSEFTANVPELTVFLVDG